MARTVKVDLIANVNGYIAGMDRAAGATRAMANDSVARLAQQRQAFDRLGRTALAVGVIAAAGVAIAIARFAEFDAAMSNVNAVTQETAGNMDLLRDAALDAGGRTVFTATEAANAIEELGKAGLSTAHILGGALDGALDLAASGQLEVARAAEITATTMKQFGLQGSDAAHIADVLSAGAGKALGSVEDLAQGLKFIGPVAASMGVSLEETIGALALFADQGLIGEQAGTSLRGVLSSLTSPSSQAAKEIERLGISLYEANGNFLGLDNVADQLSGAFSNLDDKSRDAALGIIFGNQQVTAARVLLTQGGDALRDYTAEVNDAGYAARVAADRLDNLHGDVEKLGGAFDNVLIKQGSAANDSLRGLIQGLTFLVEVAGEAPPAAVNIGLVTAAVALAGGAALMGVGKFADFKIALQGASIGARSAALSIGGVTAALTLVTFIIGAFVTAQAEAKASEDSFRESLDQTSGALTEYSRELIATRLQALGLFNDDLDPGPGIAALDDLGVTQAELTDALFEGGDAYDALLEKVDRYGKDGGPRAQLTSDRVRDSLEKVNNELQGGRSDWDELQKAQESGAKASEANADALAVLEGQAFDTSGAIDELSDQILNFGKATLDARDADRKFQAAIDDLTESVAENGVTLDRSTDAGRANEAALDDIAEASLKRSETILKETSSQELATVAIQEGREELILALAQFGITGQAAEDYANDLGLIPANVGTAVDLNVSHAEQKLLDFKASLARFASSNYGINISGYIRNSERGYAHGGILPGAPSRVDNMLIAAASGEYVVNATASSIPTNRAAMDYMNSGGNISGWSGGYMTAAPATASGGSGSGASAPQVNVTFADGMG